MEATIYFLVVVFTSFLFSNNSECYSPREASSNPNAKMSEDEKSTDKLYAMGGWINFDNDGNAKLVPPLELVFTGDDIQSFNTTTREIIFTDSSKFTPRHLGLTIYFNDEPLLENIVILSSFSSQLINNLVLYYDRIDVQKYRYYLNDGYPEICDGWSDADSLRKTREANAEKRKAGWDTFIQYLSDNDKIVTAPDVVHWIKKDCPFPGDAGMNAASFVIKDKAYVGTGYILKSNWLCTNDFWQYDSAMETWTKIADFPGEARESAIAFSSAGKGYVGLGTNGSDERLKDFYEYNPDDNTWTRIADFPDDRVKAASFVIDDVGYVGTGYTYYADRNLRSDFFKYESGQWTAVASLPSDEARFWATAYALNGKGYIVSGGIDWNGYGGTDSIWEYDPITNTWQRAGSFRTASIGLLSYVSDNIPYIVGGNSWYKYSSEENWFSRIGSVVNDFFYVWGENFFVINNVPYMTLGNTYDGPNLDLWYDADATEITGIKTVPVEKYLVYPNPVSDYFIVSGMSGAQISISDLSGRILLKKSNIRDKETISVSGWQRGIYLLMINKNENHTTGKIIIR